MLKQVEKLSEGMFSVPALIRQHVDEMSLVGPVFVK